MARTLRYYLSNSFKHWKPALLTSTVHLHYYTNGMQALEAALLTRTASGLQTLDCNEHG